VVRSKPFSFSSDIRVLRKISWIMEEIMTMQFTAIIVKMCIPPKSNYNMIHVPCHIVELSTITHI